MKWILQTVLIPRIAIAVPSQQLKRLFGFRWDVTHVSKGLKRVVAFDVEMYVSLLCYVIAEINLVLHKKEIPLSVKKACKALEEVFKALAICHGNKWCLPRSKYGWHAVRCAVVRLRVTADTLTSFVRCTPICRVNEEFCNCHLPFAKFLCHICMGCFCRDQHYHHDVRQLHEHMEEHNPCPIQLDRRDAAYDICYPKSNSFITCGISRYMNFTSFMYQLI